MHDNNVRQIDEGHRASLAAAGIGKAYHDRSLGQEGELDKPVGEFMSGGGFAHLKEGGNIHVYGHNVRSYDITLLLARALHLTGTGCSCSHTLTLLENWSADFEAKLARAKLLVLKNIYAP